MKRYLFLLLAGLMVWKYAFVPTPVPEQ